MESIRIVFVGDEPSKKNLDDKVAFVGTKSYERLCSWMPKLEISLNSVVICNKKDFTAYNYCEGFTLNTPQVSMDIFLESPYFDKVIALGDKVSKYLDKIGCDHFKLPHPSPSNNAILYDFEKMNKFLENCKKWLKNE